MADETPSATQEQESEGLVLTSPDEASSPKDFLLWAGVIALAVLTIYSPAMHGEFIWDDDRHVELNRNLRDLDGLVNIWTKFGLRNGGTVQYYPLTHTTFWLEYQLSGARPGEIPTIVFHITNMVLHAGGAILLWFVLRALAVPGAWAAAAIFAVHPIEAESVAWISERKNVLAGVFFFGAMLAFVRAEKLDRNGTPEKTPNEMHWLAFALFVCALFSKTMSVTLPAVLLLVIWLKRGRIAWRDVILVAPFFAVGLAMALVTGWIEHSQVGARGADWDLSIPQRILIAGKAVWFYAWKLVWPMKLTFIYPRWEVNPGLIWQWIYPIGVVIVLAALWIMRGRIGRGPVVAVAAFVVMLSPALGFVDFYPMRFSFVADHYQYLAGTALIALIVAAIASLLLRIRADIGKTPAPYVIAGIAIAALGVLTLLQSSIYVSHKTLWADTVKKNPSAWLAQANLGTALLNEAAKLSPDEADQIKKNLDLAIEHLEQATQLRRNYDFAYAKWGQVLLRQDKAGEALEKLDTAMAINPGNFEAVVFRAAALEKLNRAADAKSAYERALNIASTQPIASPGRLALIHRSLAEIADAAGDSASAQAHFAEVVDLAPNVPAYRHEYAKLLARHGKREQAAAQFDIATQLNPQNIDAHIDLAMLMIEVGNLKGAQVRLTAATEIARQFNLPTARLRDAAQKWAAAYEASTRPSTTQAGTQPATTRAAP